MKKWLLYGFGGSYNHGSEAIVQTTIQQLREIDAKMPILLSTHFKEQDLEMGLDVDQYLERDWKGVLQEKNIPYEQQNNRMIYRSTIDEIDKETICLSIGGDNFCYAQWRRWRDIHLVAKEIGAVSVLWSCSVDEAYITREMLEIFKTFDLITVRECISYNVLRKHGLSNLCMCADIAFLLKPMKVMLPQGGEKRDLVAVNISPLMQRREKVSGILIANIVELIHYIIYHEKMKVILVPHVLMSADNDIDMHRRIMQKIDVEVHNDVINIEDNLHASQYKYIISQCRYAVLCRTHAAIAAYSSVVPTLAITYSDKGRGIACDLEMDEYAISIDEMNKKNDVLKKFLKLMEEEENIRKTLRKKKPYMEEMAMQNGRYLRDLIGEKHG